MTFPLKITTTIVERGWVLISTEPIDKDCQLKQLFTYKTRRGKQFLICLEGKKEDIPEKTSEKLVSLVKRYLDISESPAEEKKEDSLENDKFSSALNLNNIKIITLLFNVKVSWQNQE